MKSHLPIRPELREWILSTTRAGHSVEAVLKLMQETGYDPRQSRSIVATVLNMPISALDPNTLPTKTPGRRTRHPEPPQMEIDGHTVHIGLSMESPALRVLNDFLSADECIALIEQATPRLQRAKTVDSSGKQQIDARRTSEGMFFTTGETPLIKRIEQRIASMLSIPVDHGEGLQVLHYLPGQQYEPHYDWFNPEQPGFAAITAQGGQRIASLVMYLNTPDAGGGTAFPEVGVTVTARRGAAVYFAYDTGDEASLHAGLPVQKGEKWIATKWLRERPFQKNSR
ncbi:2-oxoglutarate-dependent dioxygenase [Dyella monticola]|uniref:2-oxoglutarate-dependent dioxygenase n=1 Tax=Dyella monticola TaxID=1927958 RepID=A0A370WVR1_9GAMM|nr:2OG-Fe(II) oxygenase [Dyella monticola]RDS80107.1 2-oxoglutarate-dependent dioxygenase [Dyella monticola]